MTAVLKPKVAACLHWLGRREARVIIIASLAGAICGWIAGRCLL